MNCEQVRGRLDDWLDGGPEPGENEAVREHVRDCPACRAERDAAERIRREAAELPRAVEPPRDLWPDIRERIAPSGGVAPASREVAPRRVSGWLIAAAAAASVVIGLLAVIAIPRRPAPEPTVAVEPAAPAAVLASYDAVESEFRETRRRFLRNLEANREHLDPGTVRIVLDNLELMDRAAREIREALEEDPGNVTLKRMLLASYRKQVGLLHSFGEIPEDL